MRPVRVTVTGIGDSAVIPIDQYQRPTNIALGCVITSGTATYTVQHTFDDVFSPTFNPGTAVWFDHPVIAGKTTNFDSNYAAPPRGVRLHVTASTGVVQMTLVQSGAA
jgi:hypothetical protein